MRFGSLTDFSVVRKTVNEVSLKLRVPWSTVKRTLTKFEESGSQLSVFYDKKPRLFPCIPPHVKKLLLSQDLL